MRAEGDDGFAAERMALKQCEERHGQGSPPVGIADEDGVVLFKVRDDGADVRPGIPSLLLLRLLHDGVVVGRIRTDGFKFQNVPADFAVDVFGKSAGIAGMRKIQNKHVSSFVFCCRGGGCLKNRRSGAKRHHSCGCVFQEVASGKKIEIFFDSFHAMHPLHHENGIILEFFLFADFQTHGKVSLHPGQAVHAGFYTSQRHKAFGMPEVPVEYGQIAPWRIVGKRSHGRVAA